MINLFVITVLNYDWMRTQNYFIISMHVWLLNSYEKLFHNF